MPLRIPRLFRRRRIDPDCEHVRNVSSEFIDGELSEAEEARVTAHTGWCPPCDAFINTLRATVSLLRAAPKREAPDELRHRLRDSLRKERSL